MIPRQLRKNLRKLKLLIAIEGGLKPTHVLASATMTFRPISSTIKVTEMITAPNAKIGMQKSLGAKTQLMNGASLITSGATFQPSVRDPFQLSTLMAQSTRVNLIGKNAKMNKRR